MIPAVEIHALPPAQSFGSAITNQATIDALALPTKVVPPAAQIINADNDFKFSQMAERKQNDVKRKNEKDIKSEAISIKLNPSFSTLFLAQIIVHPPIDATEEKYVALPLERSEPLSREDGAFAREFTSEAARLTDTRRRALIAFSSSLSLFSAISPPKNEIIGESISIFA